MIRMHMESRNQTYRLHKTRMAVCLSATGDRIFIRHGATIYAEVVPADDQYDVIPFSNVEDVFSKPSMSQAVDEIDELLKRGRLSGVTATLDNGQWFLNVK